MNLPVEHYVNIQQLLQQQQQQSQGQHQHTNTQVWTKHPDCPETTIPEPGTTALLAIALIGIGCLKFIKK